VVGGAGEVIAPRVREACRRRRDRCERSRRERESGDPDGQRGQRTEVHGSPFIGRRLGSCKRLQGSREFARSQACCPKVTASLESASGQGHPAEPGAAATPGADDRRHRAARRRLAGDGLARAQRQRPGRHGDGGRGTEGGSRPSTTGPNLNAQGARARPLDGRSESSASIRRARTSGSSCAGSSSGWRARRTTRSWRAATGTRSRSARRSTCCWAGASTGSSCSAGRSPTVSWPFAAARTPVIVVGRTFRGHTAQRLRVDHRTGAVEATRHLLELGHRRIAYLAGDVSQRGCARTAARLCRGARAGGRRDRPGARGPGDVRDRGRRGGGSRPARGGRRVHGRLRGERQLAAGAQLGLHRYGLQGAGRRVARGVRRRAELGVRDAAADDGPAGTCTGFGIAAAEGLLRLLDGADPALPVFRTRLVVRETTAAPPRLAG